MAQDPGASIFQYDHILDSDTTPSGDVDARFDGEWHSVFEWRGASWAYVWFFMYLEAQAVTEAVAEVVGVASVVDDFSRYGVGFTAGDAGGYVFDSGFLCF